MKLSHAAVILALLTALVVVCVSDCPRASAKDTVSDSDKKDAPSRYQSGSESPTQPLTKEQQAEVRAKGRLRKKIAPVFKRADLVKTSRKDRPNVNDYFVVAKFHMPLATRAAELRFEVTEGVDASTDKVADYLLETPEKTVRDFRVVSRFKSEQDAEAGLQLTRKRYDDYREYQAKLLAYLKAERAKSLRRC